MLFDIRALRWDDELCDLFGVPVDRLPEVAPVERALRRHVGPLRRAGRASRSAASPATSRRRCSARPASSPGMTKNTYGTGSFVLHERRRRPVPPPVEGLLTTVAWTLADGTRAPTPSRAPSSSTGVGHPVAARRARDHRRRGRDRAARRAASTTAAASYLVPAFTGLGQPVVGPVRPGHDRRDHPGHDPRPPRPGRRRGDGVPDPRRRRRHGCGRRPAADRAAGRRRRVGDGPAAAAAGRPARGARRRPCDERPQRSAPPTWPAWPRAWCRTSPPSPPSGSSRHRSHRPPTARLPTPPTEPGCAPSGARAPGWRDHGAQAAVAKPGVSPTAAPAPLISPRLRLWNGRRARCSTVLSSTTRSRVRDQFST